MIFNIFQTLGNGVLLGSIYALLGLCIVLIYKASRAFNFAIGQLLVIGSFLFYALFVKMSLPLLVAFPLGLLAAGVMGFLVEKLAINPLMGRDPLLMTKSTLGLFFFLGAALQIVLLYVGSPGWAPLGLPDITFISKDLIFLSENIWGGICSVITFVFVLIVFQRTRIGLAIRAVSENQAAAIAYGINSRFVLMIAWAISSASIAVAGIVISNMGILSPSTAAVGFRAIPVVVIGGMDSIGGALVAGLLVGICETAVAMYLEPAGLVGFKDVSVYIVMLVMLFFRPHGLFGTTGIERV